MTEPLASTLLAALPGLKAERAEFSGIRLAGPLQLSPQAIGEWKAAAWSLAPLADANGEIRARITDAQLFFDADVTVPIRQGRVDFRDASVAHVGPDSRMGAAPEGIYVDAAGGRSYLYRFAQNPMPGVQYERRAALLGPWVSDRGKLDLQPFAEALMHQGRSSPGLGFSEQTLQLLARTALSGELRLGDGRFAVPGLQGELFGRAEGNNTIRPHSAKVDRGLMLDLPNLALRNVVFGAGGMQLACDELTAALTLAFVFEGARIGYVLEIARVAIANLRLDRPVDA
jgi:hypothetical protein